MSAPKRICQIVKLKPETYAEYKKYHDEIWPEVLEAIKTVNIGDYSIFLDDRDYTLIGVFKYFGKDFDGDMAKFRQNESMQKWWKITDNMQDTLVKGSSGSTDEKGCSPPPTMSTPTLTTTPSGLLVAIEGCGHGVLTSIYASCTLAAQRAGWPTIDLLIIGGDFQAVRNANDLACVSMPHKYRSMQDFHLYYSGQRKAPYLTVFVGGNHEASNYLSELHYGGWVAENIYFLGAANVLDVGGLRIAGMSGIWKGYDYRKPHGERLPYNADEVRSVYHTREVDVRKLLAVRTQVDVGISHDWPKGVEWLGDHQRLWRGKGHLEQDAREGRLGNVAAKMVLERLRPRWWFSAHLHVKYAAVVKHEGVKQDVPATRNGEAEKDEDEIDLMEDEVQPATNGSITASARNEDEIDLDMDDEEATPQTNGELHGANGAPEPVTEEPVSSNNEVSDSLRAQLPEAFTRQKTPPPPSLPFPEDIKNTTTKFLALDKCLPDRDFLQLTSIPLTESSGQVERPVKLRYDKEWLAITRVFASDLTFGGTADVPKHKGEAYYRPLIEAEEKWIEDNLVKTSKMKVPENFQITAPVYDGQGISKVEMPREYTNNQTKQYCEMLEIPNPFDISEEERDARMQRGPAPVAERNDRGGRGGFGRGGGRGQRGGRGRGGYGRGRGARGGRW
ncbi:Lariat debranching enzyme-like protein [Elsinoe fawcettii]|nr:Lariat debranching enzyme-like protein [Elsinoe fawcettii]